MRIELRDVWKRFGSILALQGVAFEVPSGTRVGLVGPNGSGKSTLLRALLGLVACDGDVLLDGVSPFEHRTEVARRLAYVPQVAPNWGAPVREVIESVASLRGIDGSRIAEMARRLGLEIPPIERRPFRNLSGGMKQKLLIAIALATDASLLVLDEPTASLDSEAQERFFTLLDEVAPHATRLFCSHRRDDIVEHVDRVIALADGKVVFDGDAETYLAAQPPHVPRTRAGRAHLQIVPRDASDSPSDATRTRKGADRG